MSASSDDKDLKGLIADAFPEQVITNWIIIAEVVDNDSRDLNIGTSDGMTSWLGAGMLECAKEIILSRDALSSDWTEWDEDAGDDDQ